MNAIGEGNIGDRVGPVVPGGGTEAPAYQPRIRITPSYVRTCGSQEYTIAGNYGMPGGSKENPMRDCVRNPPSHIWDIVGPVRNFSSHRDSNDCGHGRVQGHGLLKLGLHSHNPAITGELEIARRT